jgi:hypothetical protein
MNKPSCKRRAIKTADTPLSPNEKMNAAFVNYFALSDILQKDLTALLDSESDSQHWRRNYIRISASLIEGYAFCLREMCAVSFDSIAPEIGQKEKEILRSERNFNANERIKITLRVAYKLFDLQSTISFGGSEWSRAQRVLEKRHLLMHPKTPSDLQISDGLWDELRCDVTWLIEQLFSFFSALEKKYGG